MNDLFMGLLLLQFVYYKLNLTSAIYDLQHVRFAVKNKESQIDAFLRNMEYILYTICKTYPGQ